MKRKPRTEFDPELAKIALLVIEHLAAQTGGSFTINAIYRFAHVGRGGCVEHDNWVKELRHTFDTLRTESTELTNSPHPVWERTSLQDLYEESLARVFLNQFIKENGVL